MKKIMFLFLLLIPLRVNASKIEVSFSKCVDGDTAWFTYKDETLKVRFLAIDTPESTKEVEPFGKEASNFTCSEIKKASKIELEYDTNSDKTDKYNRTLAWVFVDDELLQAKIIDAGLGEVAYLYGDYKYTDLLKEKQSIAKNNNIGMWGEYKDYSAISIILIVIVVILLCIFSKNFRKKTFSKLKRKTKQILKDSI